MVMHRLDACVSVAHQAADSANRSFSNHRTLWQYEPSSVQKFLRSVLAVLRTFVRNRCLQQHLQSGLSGLVVMVDRLEGTLPRGTHKALDHLKVMAATTPVDLHTPAASVWDAEGGSSGAAGKQ